MLRQRSSHNQPQQRKPGGLASAHHERVTGIRQAAQTADLGGLTGQKLLQERAARAAQRPDLAPLAADYDRLADPERAALQHDLRISSATS